MLKSLLGALVLVSSGTAWAQGEPPPPPPEDELPVPTLTIDRLPPNTSWEFAVQVSYGAITYWRDYVPPWIGFGVRSGYGKHFGKHRLGVDGLLAVEGPIGVHTSMTLEPSLSWNFVSDGGVLLGAGAGPGVMYHQRNDTVIGESAWGSNVGANARLGWSQGWTRVGRRVFVFLEPKARVIDSTFSPSVALVIGSGGGA